MLYDCCTLMAIILTISSSTLIVSTLSGLPSTVSIVPNTHLHGAVVVPLSNTHHVISLKLTNNNYLLENANETIFVGWRCVCFCWQVLSLSCTLYYCHRYSNSWYQSIFSFMEATRLINYECSPLLFIYWNSISCGWL